MPRALLSLLIGTLACTALTGRPYRVEPEGYERVRFGMTLREARAYGAPLEPAAPIPDGERGCYYVFESGRTDGPGYMVVGERVVRIDVRGAAPLTDTGIGVGSLESEVLAAYGTRVQASPHKYTDGRYLTVDAGEHAIVFETDGTRVTRYRAGRKPEVTWVEGCS